MSIFMSSTKRLNDIVNAINCVYEIENADNAIQIVALGKTLPGAENELTFISKGHSEASRFLSETKSQIIICDPSLKNSGIKDKCLIYVENPKMVFAQIGNQLFKKTPEFSIHPTSFIHPSVKLPKLCRVGAFAVIEANCEIGEGTVIGPNCTLYEGTLIGKNVIINAGAVIGADGFGYEYDENNVPFNFPHISHVIIEDGVHIGSNTCVDRGSLGPTWIKENVKIDNLVHVAHNVIIEENSYVIANSMIGGSTHIGKNCWISPSVSLRDRINIGDFTLVGMGSVVAKDIGNNEVWMGSPARPLKEFKELNSKLKNL